MCGPPVGTSDTTPSHPRAKLGTEVVYPKQWAAPISNWDYPVQTLTYSFIITKEHLEVSKHRFIRYEGRIEETAHLFRGPRLEDAKRREPAA